MKKTTIFCLRNLLCALVLSSSFISSYASHLVGGDLYYTHVSGNTYTITVALYGDCGIASAAAFSTLPISMPQVCIYNGNTSVTSISLALDSPAAGIEITPLCAGDSSQCTNTASIRPGVKKYVYSANYTLPTTSAVWRFIYDGDNGPGSAAGRAASTTNLVSPGSYEVQLIDTLNNMTSDNSNPRLTVTQQTFFCVNQHDIYNPGAVDPDGDSLSINLTNATEGSTDCGMIGGAVTYLGIAWPGGVSVSAANPLQVAGADSFTMNNTTGNMFFNPITQRSTVVYNIEEYRAGILVGTSQREMSVIVVNCDTLFPCMYVPRPGGGGGGTGTGVAPLNQTGNAQIYPNPATEELTVTMTPDAHSAYTITNTIGKVLLQNPLTTAQTSINIATLPAGLYYITLTNERGSSVQKFVKL